METTLHGPHQSTYEAIFKHPVARNLTWRDVRAMLGELVGLVQEEHGGALKITRNGRTLILQQPLRKNIADVQELMNLRQFLEHSATVAT